ncbi:nucleoside diphosphate kinase regulator [Devosia geojensis]|uniref:nucleoside diphosphate kinase regulator n=1 Tax=Devosia geojensis TaxID=443610 RepID=UPI000A8893A8|nr:nucleoside diphosphate kinase regulator [Devosia geojensis]
MSKLSTFKLQPEILVGENEHRKLLVLALSGVGHTADAADDLLYELERARIRPDHALPPDTVRMGSTVRYRTEAGETRQVRLVYPGAADISQGAVSVLTPVGTALIGLRTGQSITWTTRDGRRSVLTILEVTDPSEPDPEFPSAA